MGLDVRKVAAEAPDGTFSLRTQGPSDLRHAELEVVGVPACAVEPAAKLIDFVVEMVIERQQSELKDGENAAVRLGVEGQDEELCAFVHATRSQAAGGLLATLRRKKGTLRLVDLGEDQAQTVRLAWTRRGDAPDWQPRY